MERIKHARRLIRAASARAAGNAGTDLLRTYNMRNTNDYLHAKNTERFKLQALKNIIERFLNPDPRIGDKESRIEAPSSKRHGPWNKFHGPLTVRPDQDKCILWMCFMEGNLVW